MLTQSHTAIRTPVDDNLDDNFNESNWIIRFKEPQALNDLAISLSILELLEEQKCDQFRRLILATNASDPSSEISESDNGLLPRRHSPIIELQ